MKAAEGADLVLHLTEWADYRVIDPSALSKSCHTVRGHRCQAYS